MYADPTLAIAKASNGMTDFIELTDTDDNDKVVINTAFILTIQKNGASGALIKIVHSGCVQTVKCKESYSDVASLLTQREPQ